MTWALMALVLLVPRRARRPERAALSPQVIDRIALAAGACLGLVLLPVPVDIAAAAIGAPLARVAVRRLARRATRAGSGSSLALALSLAAAALRAGAPTVTALECAQPAADAESAAALGHVAALLRLGASPSTAWGTLTDERWISVAALARRSGDSGIRLAGALDRAAEQILAQQRADATARAHRVGVLAVGPLGACFLPAFVCLGIVPVVISVALGVGGRLR